MRATFKPTKDQSIKVSVWAACGTPQKEIAQRIINPESSKSIDLKTLRRAFREELDAGMHTANAIVAQTLFKKATSADGGSASVTAAIFWLKCRAGWKDVQSHEIVSGSLIDVMVYVPNNARG